MAFPVTEWLKTGLPACCAVGGGDRDFAARVLGGLYPALLAEGRGLPPSVVVDMALLFESSVGVRFTRPSGLWSVDDAGLTAYCDFLNGAGTPGPFHRTLDRVRDLRRIAPGGAASTRCLELFLQVASMIFPPCGNLGELRNVAADWPNPVVAADLAGTAANVAARQMVTRFFRDCRNWKFDRLAEEAFFPLLAEVAAPFGAAALDLPLLQACLDYRSVSGIDSSGHRLPVRNIKPRENRRSRTPEMGNHGIDRRGGITAVLRSFLARDDFFDRLYRREVLYFRRKAPRLEPRRVLVAFILEKSLVTKARRVGVRCDTVASQLAAALLEDTERAAGAVPVLDLHTLVLLHNGESFPALRCAVMKPQPFEVQSMAALNGDGPSGWLPRLTELYPRFFFMEPEWPAQGAMPVGGEEWEPLARVLRLFRTLAPRLNGMDGADGTQFDLAMAVVFGDGAADPASLLPILKPLARAVTLHTCVSTGERLEWTTVPRLLRGDVSPTGSFSRAAKDFDRIRLLFLRDLARRLGAIGG